MIIALLAEPVSSLLILHVEELYLAHVHMTSLPLMRLLRVGGQLVDGETVLRRIDAFSDYGLNV
jgi:hypothetical protein